MTKNTISVGVFCGSRSGDSPEYIKAARDIGSIIADQGWTLIYGAGDVGLMAEVSHAATEAGGRVVGVIPKHLIDLEVARHDLDHLVVTETMHERKKVMFMNADAFIILPGGLGSLDEFFEILTWRQLGLHNKPIILVNINHYWDALITLLNHVVKEGFADEKSTAHLFDVVVSPSEVSRVLRSQIS